jgi:CRISPR-associated protein Cmr5
VQTRDQLYAQDAFDRVLAIKNENFTSNYGSMAHRLPILIHTSGLAQALEFVYSRGTEGAKKLLADLSQTVLHGSEKKLLKQSRESDLRVYILLTEQILAALLWYKRYAQSILNVEQGDQDDENEPVREAK